MIIIRMEGSVSHPLLRKDEMEVMHMDLIENLTALECSLDLALIAVSVDEL